MADIKAGDRVRIKERPDWPMPGGYKLANSEGQVFEVIDEPEGYVTVLLDKNTTGIDASITLAFRIEAVEKI
jgi:hypothetical protein